MKPQRLVEFGNHGRAAAVQGVPRGAGRQEIGPVRPGLWTSVPIGGAGLQERFATQVVATILSLRPGGSRKRLQGA
jgi:hypothetical protein